MSQIKLGLHQRTMQWIMGRDTGSSSRAIVGQMTGVTGQRSHPWDIDDFGRCVRMLDVLPEYRSRLDEMKPISMQWKLLVEHWDELETLYYAWEADRHDRRGTERIKELIAQAETVPEHGKALTLWQPWASLVASDQKRYETRSWSTTYRGLLVIHSAKKWTRDLLAITRQLQSDYAPFSRRFELALDYYLPRGSALCVVDLVDVHRVEAVRDQLRDEELAFGDYSDGRYAWKLRLMTKFRHPVPMRGKQGLWSF